MMISLEAIQYRAADTSIMLRCYLRLCHLPRKSTARGFSPEASSLPRMIDCRMSTYLRVLILLDAGMLNARYPFNADAHSRR